MEIDSLARDALHLYSWFVLFLILSRLLATIQFTKVLASVRYHGRAQRALDINPIIVGSQLLA